MRCVPTFFYIFRAPSDSLLPAALDHPPSTDQALDLPGLLPWFRKKCLSALCKICGRQALLPRSLRVPLCYDRSDDPLYRGGYADVWKGEHRGRHVAVKVLRVYSTSDFDKITNVGFSVCSKACVDQLTSSADPCRGSARRSWHGKLLAIRTCCHCWERQWVITTLQ